MILNNDLLEKINNYLKVEQKPVICIVWPTATGKTSFAVELLKKINWELINADSRQIYKWIECITWLDYEEIKDVKYHLFWVAEITKVFTVSEYLDDVRKLIIEIHLRWNVPIIVWWTWLFVSSLIEWFEIPQNSFDESLRSTFNNKSNEELYEELKKVDPESIKDIHINNRVRIERALEVFYLTWKKKSEWVKSKIKVFNPLIFCKKVETEDDRKLLYDKINERQRFLFKRGISEFNNWDNSFAKFVNECLQDHNKLNILPAYNSIWIPEILSYLSWEITKEQAVEKIQQSARNYAKRQLTWWRKKKGIEYV